MLVPFHSDIQPEMLMDGSWGSLTPSEPLPRILNISHLFRLPLTDTCSTCWLLGSFLFTYTKFRMKNLRQTDSVPLQYQDPRGACTHGDPHCWAVSSMKWPSLGVCIGEVLMLLNVLLLLNQVAKTPLSHAWMTPQQPRCRFCPPAAQALSGSTGMFPAKVASPYFRPQLVWVHS